MIMRPLVGCIVSFAVLATALAYVVFQSPTCEGDYRAQTAHHPMDCR